ncbi:uncharacterized protein [Antedon mediterranea]|uniref:uncharacterized protein isoform X2 n=1 Tax=Antedon mediterranea TaxID=105859 RepID=UPI003AF97896
MNWFIIVHLCLINYVHTSSASIDISSFRVSEDVTHSLESNMVNFTLGLRILEDESFGDFNISFYSSQSNLHVYIEEVKKSMDFPYCHLGNVKENVFINESSSMIELSLQLKFPNTKCCETAASLCVYIESVENANETDDYCLPYNYGVTKNEAAGHKDCTLGGTTENPPSTTTTTPTNNPTADVIYIIIICVGGVLLLIMFLVIVCVCCRRFKDTNEPIDVADEMSLDTLRRVSIDLNRKCHSPSFAELDTGPPIKTNLPTMDSFFFGPCSSHLQQEELLPQDFLSAFMKKYVEFVTEWNKSAKKDTSPVVSNSKTKLTVPSGETRRISIKRRPKLKGERDSAVYVNQWDSSMEIPRDRIELFEKIGEGQFGEVHRAVLQDEGGSKTVAVKKLKKGTNKDDKNNFLRELATHALLENHPHVIQLIGCCIEKEPMLVIFEYMANGNLLDYLKNTPESVSSALNYVVTFGHHVAEGMKFLAATEVIHRDLAARNILINQSGICKVADFGFAKDVFGVTKYTKKIQTAPIRWMAPESLLDGVFSTQSDVWSFGVLLWEIVTLGREVPYFDIRSIDIKRKLKEGLRLRKPGHCPTDLYALMAICWNNEPEERPTFETLCKEFIELESLGHYTLTRISHLRKPSKLRGLVNRITRQLSNGEAI